MNRKTHSKKIYLPEERLPKAWYNIVADMPNKPLPPLHPATKKPVGPDDLAPLFPEALIMQEVTQERYVEIPAPVREIYKIWRPSPLIRAYELEKALDTPAKIYYKYEGVSPSGSHKPNTAVAQAFYNAEEGVKKITTETGAGQWGSALSYATQLFGIELQVFMVKVSYNQKPYRKTMMNIWKASVTPSPSGITDTGRKISAEDPGNPGSLGIAISEAVEMAVNDPSTKYSLGSVLNHVLLHQTVIGLEAKAQMEQVDAYPDVVIGCFGGGSNFAGISFPFVRDKIVGGKDIRIIAVEPDSCPKLTRGQFRYDFGDTIGMTPLIPMYTLGHGFMPPAIHAGGLRYHGAGAIVSQLLNDGFIEASAVPQLESFEAGMLFARTEGIIPAPESTHAVTQTIREALKAKAEGKEITILFNLSGHGHIDLGAYEQYLSNAIDNYSVSDEKIAENLKVLDQMGFPKIEKQK